ncbi:MAG: toll/interleukin-1 receptor domain-containing protein [Blastocatellia bacterium]
MADDFFKYDVFLSHSSKDKAVVRAVAERLRIDKLRVWFDEWELKPGHSIPAKVEEGLEQSRVLVLCMSANAFGSDWAKLESYTFRFRDPLNKERRFILLRLDDAPIKGSLAQFLYINWLPEECEREYAKLLEACRPPAKPSIVPTQLIEERSPIDAKLDVVIGIPRMAETSVTCVTADSHPKADPASNVVRLNDIANRRLTKFEIDKLVLRYIGVNSGYLGDFSYRKHYEFYLELNLDIDPNNYDGTTRERFIKILSESTLDVQARILEGILSRYPVGSSELRTQERYDEIAGWIVRLRA